ncbi:hypothetical protein OG792_20770 [Micromonospora sp. NBC_01699]|uniref:hypothetical protein n=1 Tax=Micromonospora sp. NBC_01699 TaxID=2975984 RepID=UPI002E28475C|nr:hypothetical protein [Micromonospora sp. NBC_01699]
MSAVPIRIMRRHRLQTILIALFTAASTLVAQPALAGGRGQGATGQPAVAAEDQMCTSGSFSQVPPLGGNPVTWWLVGSKVYGAYNYRYWLNEQGVPSVGGYRWNYQGSRVVACSGANLISSTTLIASDGSGTDRCTSAGDYLAPGATMRFIGQRVSLLPGGPILVRPTFRYWMHTTGITIPPSPGAYRSSSVVRC